jgi:YrbI family 3-deoxy-D-manno-octulosonate 8-phosphate phosphatase
MDSTLKAIAIIPARGGSKGIPRKNVCTFNGRPLIQWSIMAALSAERVDAVVVSTDDAEIAAVSREAGADVVMRPADISTDIASSEDALIHALSMFEEQPELVVFLQCTSPLTQGEDIDRCILKLSESNADSAFTATESHRFLWKNADAAEGINHDGAKRKRRQDIQREYAENGAVYVMRTEGFLRARHRFFGKIVISEMPTRRSWEIDASDDISVAESLFKLVKQRPSLPDAIQAVVFDFDGVMTDNSVYVSENGQESVRCNRGDGWGVARMLDAGIRMAVMSTEENEVVRVRCKKLRLECFHKLGDSKFERFSAWCKEHGLNMERTIYVGNDENDVECLRGAGVGVVPADAHGSAKKVADWVLSRNGGQGAVRELCDMILDGLEE